MTQEIQMGIRVGAGAGPEVIMWLNNHYVRLFRPATSISATATNRCAAAVSRVHSDC